MTESQFQIFSKIYGVNVLEIKDICPISYFKNYGKKGGQLITKLRKGMHNKRMSLWDRFMLRKRGVIESIHNKLKNSCQIEHHRHRSPWNFLVNLLSGLIAYCQDPHKPSLRISESDRSLIQKLAA